MDPRAMTPPMSRAQINLSLKNTEEVKCPCGCNTFAEGLMLRKVSRIVTGEARDGVMPIQCFYCVKCNEALEEFLPEELRKPKLTI